MYTCKTCKLLKHSKAKIDYTIDENGEMKEYRAEADCIIDILAEWHCPYYFFSDRPPKGNGCKHWKNLNGKHWL